MSRLSPEAEQLVRAGRSVLRPSDGDRERVFQGLLQRGAITSGAGTPNAGAPSRAPAVTHLSLWKVTGVIVGLGLAGTGWFLNRGSEPAVVPSLTSPVEVTAASDRAGSSSPATADSADVPLEPTAPAAPSAEVRERRVAAAPRAHPTRHAPPATDLLAREVALLSRAGVELHAARPAAALQLLDEHARRFPNGVLVQERAATRVKALCALGRAREASAELARLSRAAPGSPHAARAAEACAVSGATK